jgi:glucose-6-phosphate isomerase
MAGKVRSKVRGRDVTDVLLMGMGGSSLCPEVLAETFGRRDGFPRLHVLDSTDPAQVRSLEQRVDLERTLFVVASKSGTTLEPNIFMSYFLERARQVHGAEEGARRFIAITDPGSQLEAYAVKEGFLKVRYGLPSVGGRYSALTNFGMVPAALMGIDLDRFMDRTEEMVEACRPCTEASENPGAALGVILGVAAANGRDKVTLTASPAMYDLGAWLEQLLAESTGKEGRALIPVDLEEPASPGAYGADRIFVYLRLRGSALPEQDRAMQALREAGQPVVTIEIDNIYDLGQEFFRWEVATAVAGAVMGINPFNQPDVEASKVATRKLTDEYEQTGSLPAEDAVFEEGGIRLFTDEANAAELRGAAAESTFGALLGAHLGRLGEGDYFAILAYVEMNGPHREVLQRIRHHVREKLQNATCLGFGPRFLHSTGQAYKGGPNTGVFLQITCDDEEDLEVPGRAFTFGTVKAAQARGDFQVLAERGRRVLRVHLGTDVPAGLAKLEEAVKSVIQ